MSGEQAERCVATASKKDIVQSPSLRLRVGFAETQGVRRSMEDRMTVLGRYMACDIGTLCAHVVALTLFAHFLLLSLFVLLLFFSF